MTKDSCGTFSKTERVIRRRTQLQRTLLSWYSKEGRKGLPWRQTRDPYRILVSEFMLQQTQVDRVMPIYQQFLSIFPTFQVLGAAATADVVRAWKGLGYNNRAVRLKQIAQTVTLRYGGTLPKQKDALLAMPGIGGYTAAALRVFAFEQHDFAMDANVRRVMHRMLHGVEFPPALADVELERQSQALVPHGCAHEWNSALMDLGALICTARAAACGSCPVRSQCSAAPLERHTLRALRQQSAARKPLRARLPFELTTRFARGRIVDRLRELPAGKHISLTDLRSDLRRQLSPASLDSIEALVDKLERDGIVQRVGRRLALSD